MEEKGLLLNRIVNHQLMFGSLNVDSSIVYGRMGLVLFFFHYARYTENTLFEDFGGEILDEVFDDMHTEMSWGFESGLCGIAWGIEYLLANNFISGDSNEVLSELDKKIMEKDLRRITDYSFETGLDGLACYVALRLIGKDGRCAFDKEFIDTLMYACSKMEQSDCSPTIGLTMLLDLYNGKRVDYPYSDIIKRIVNKQSESKQEELSWRNGLKILLL